MSKATSISPAGQIFVYNPSGERIGTIEVPERPFANFMFGGADRKTLFIAARSFVVRRANAQCRPFKDTLLPFSLHSHHAFKLPEPIPGRRPCA